jgi:Phosphotransferase enzyme family
MGKFIGRPDDPAIPTLAVILDLAEWLRQLRNVLSQWDWDPSQETRIRMLKWHKTRRCTLEITVPTTTGHKDLIGKVYAEDRPDVYRFMQEIWQAGFDSKEDFSIAKPLAYLPSLRLLLYEKVGGTCARSFIMDGNGPNRVAAVERCAKWLARFHARAPRTAPALRMEEALRAWEARLQHLIDPESSLARKASRVVAQLKAISPSSNSVEMCAGHGMYTCGQVLLLEGHTVTIDWDTFNLADPSHDVARFLVDLKRKALKYFGSMRVMDWSEEVFLKSYTAAGGPPLSTLAFQQAAICLERAKSDVEKQRPHWEEQAEMMLDEGLRILNESPNR